MKTFRTLDDLSATGLTVLLRADLNVPVQGGDVTDTTRLKRLLPTLQELSEAGAKIILLSHFGRPNGERQEKYSLRVVHQKLEELLGRKIAFAEDCIGEPAEQAAGFLKNGDILLLENVRFHAEEERNDEDFAKEIAKLGDVYVNDAFSAAHRAHATTHKLAELLPAYAGRLMEAELTALEKTLEHPDRPVTAIVGGAKISTKLDLLNNLVTKLDNLVLGGGMANTFLFAKGADVGTSLCEKDMAETAQKITQTAEEHNCTIVLPTDFLIAAELKNNVPHKTCTLDEIPSDRMILDIGPRTIEIIENLLAESKTVLWNGPVGAFETVPFDTGTTAIAKTIAKLTRDKKILSVAGGGDTVSAIILADVEKDISYISTAGGAFLEWLEGKELPGVTALKTAATKAA